MGKFRERLDLEVGWVDYDVMDKVRVGDRLAPRTLDVTFPGTEGRPRLTLTIEVFKGVPRCTDLRVSAVEDGREVRTSDLRAVTLDDWIETIVALVSDEVVSVADDGTIHSLIRVPTTDSKDHRQALKAVRTGRRAGRRQVTPDLLRRVAEVYMTHDERPVEAVELAFGTAYRTAARYVQLARAEGLIPPKGSDDVER